MDKYAIVKDGLVVNLVEYDSQPSNPPPGFDDGHEAIKVDFAGVGFTYKDGIFTPPKPFKSWILENNQWVPPFPSPDDGKAYIWNDETDSWKLLG